MTDQLHSITFGTSGYRGIVSKTFTNKHVKAIACAVATHLKEHFNEAKVIVGYDNRTGNCPNLSPGSYTKTLVDTLIEQGIHVHFFKHFAPTPLVSWAIEHLNAQGGLILTASHNPPNYNGLKFNAADGAPANEQITSEIAQYATEYLQNPPATQKLKGSLETICLDEAFSTNILKNIEKLLGNASKDLHLCIDCRHGATAQAWKALLNQSKHLSASFLNESPEENFGFLEPNPTKAGILDQLSLVIKEKGAALGVANDPDGDRHVLLDENGSALLPEVVACIIVSYLTEIKSPIYGVATTLASSAIVKTCAEKLGLNFEEKNIGFKYFSNFFKQARKKQQIGLAVESSGGLSLSNHTLEKCGFLPALLIARIIQLSGKKLSELVTECYYNFGNYAFGEDAWHFEEHQRNQVKHFIDELNLDLLQQKLPFQIRSVNKNDGTKIQFENKHWGLIRVSGTEPIARLYAESDSHQKTQVLLNHLKEILDNYS